MLRVLYQKLTFKIYLARLRSRVCLISSTFYIFLNYVKFRHFFQIDGNVMLGRKYLQDYSTLQRVVRIM